MEWIVCMLLASLITAARPVSDALHLLNGKEPPHLTKARLKADRQAQKLAEQRARRENRQPRPGEDKPTLRDVVRVYWGDALADVIDAHDRRRAEKKAQRAEDVQAAAEGRRPRQVRPSWRDRARRAADLLLHGRRPATAEATDVTAAVNKVFTDDSMVIACPDCGQRLTNRDGSWWHPSSSGCPQQPTPPPVVVPPRLTDEEAAELREHARKVGERMGNRRRAAAQLAEPVPADVRPGTVSDQKTNQEDDMTDTTASTAPTATGDAHDLESAIQQCDLLDDDLSRINTAIDVIDEAIGRAGDATELIEAFLRSKNVDDTTVGGMATARDMLGPDRIKALIDAVSAAKQGVQNTKEALTAMHDAASAALNGADGSIVNGR